MDGRACRGARPRSGDVMNRVEQFALGGSRSQAAIHIGLVNNMPDGALRATELQFARLLKEASGPLDVRLRLFSLRSIPRGDQARARMDGFYDDANFLEAAQMDALIVTGTQRNKTALHQEPFWKEFGHLVDWAQANTLSTLFSGAAAEAAVLHLDAIASRPLPRKLSGVFDAHQAEDDPLFFNMPKTLAVPHARCFNIPESDLAAKGYRVLTRLSEDQVDIFTRELAGQSRFVFLQGHPEYDPGTLGVAYLDDLERFLKGQTKQRPAIPERYFDRATEHRLAEIAKDTSLSRHQELIRAALPLQIWRSHAVRLVGNWLTLVAAAKGRYATSRAVHTRQRAS